MASLLANVKRRAFWVFARTCFALYRWFPVFGSLRASIGIIHRGEKILVILRNDGRGLSLPGGLSARNEAEEKTLRREVLEETGLSVGGLELRMRYHSTADVPCNISVFEVEASGELTDSWEGSPRWMTPAELESQLLESQRPAIELLRKISAEAHRKNEAQGNQR